MDVMIINQLLRLGVVEMKQSFLTKKDLEKALLGDEFYIVAQPFFDKDLTTCLGAEVLMRWYHKKHGNITPDIFIPMAFEYGLTSQLTDLTFILLDKFFLKKINKIDRPFYITININNSNFKDNKLIDVCKIFISKAEKVNISLILELSENIPFEDSKEIDIMIDTLRTLKVKFALDDFGVGYSTLHYIKRFKPEFIKIDKSILHMDKDDYVSRTILKSINTIANDLNIGLIAEGIENENHLHLLDEVDLFGLQGYYLSLPICLKEIIALI